jgi:long-chain acyl-CoA synthetase
MSSALGAWLQSLGLKPGDRVALMMPNVPQYLVAMAAVLRAGLVVVNVNPLYTARELEHQLKDSGAVAIMVLENFATRWKKSSTHAGVKHVVLASMGELLGFWYGRWINFAVRTWPRWCPSSAAAGQGRTVTRFAQRWKPGHA